MTTLDLTAAQVAELAAGTPVTVTPAPVAVTLTPPSVTPPPPPPGTFFLAAPAGWTSVLQEDFTKVTSLPAGDWTYGGRPGGTTGCTWEASQLTFSTQGARIRTQFANGGWISAGFGTTKSFSFPLRVRWYDLLADANIDGKNKVNLLWCNPWIEEVDADECAISGGKWQPTIARIHNGSSANVTTPIVQTAAQPVGTVHCHEVELAEVNGVPTFTVFVDGVQSGTPAVIPASDWATFRANPHWIGTQDELYNIGTAPQTAVSDRYVLGIEAFQPA